MNTATQEQPAAPDSNVSLEDRIGAIMGGQKPQGHKPQPDPPAPAIEEPEQQEAASDEVDATESPEAPPVSDTFEFEVDGEKFVLPKKLEKSFMQEKDYTQSKQNLSQREKQIEILQEQARIANFRAEFEKEAGEELQQLRAYDAVLKKQYDWSTMSTDEKVSLLADITRWEKERQSIADSVREKHQQWERKTDEAMRELASKADAVVKQRVPNWSDSTWNEIREHAKSDGYTDVELNTIHDPRHKLTLWKARQFDQLKAKATKTVVDAKAVKTSPANPMPQAVKDKLSFRKEISRHAPGSEAYKAALANRVGKIFG